MRERIVNFKYFITESEVDALILECNLIKKYRPEYNIDYKDDKSYPFIKITRESFPSISLVRIPPSFTNDYPTHAKRGCPATIHEYLFGPYPKVKIVKEAMRKIRSIFPLRNCQREIREEKTTPLCLDYHIGLCAGPCEHKIAKEEYRKLVRGLTLLLKGEKKGLIRDLKRRMNELSRDLKFEEAARLRNQLLGLEELVGTGSVQSGWGLSHLTSSGTTRLIGGYPDSALAKQSRPLRELQFALNLPSLPVRIEGIDVSNIGGDFATGSLVIFNEGVPCKNDYRHFRIKSVEGINDVQMLAEVARRHYSSDIMPEADPPEPRWRESGPLQINCSAPRGYPIHHTMPLLFPDLILVDGGIAQLNAVSKALEEFKLKIPIVSLAKRLEEVFKKEGGKVRKIYLSLSSPALHLLQHIRDEAHRFAIKYHKILRKKELRKSILDEIPGIGEKRKKILLKYFRSIEEIKKSSIDELKKLGIPSSIAWQILSI